MTTYGDISLKFPSKAAADQILYRTVDPSGEIVQVYQGSIDVIGEWYDVDNTDPENPKATKRQGWFVNVRGELPPAFDPFIFVPVTPMRVWLGD